MNESSSHPLTPPPSFSTRHSLRSVLSLLCIFLLCATPCHAVSTVPFQVGPTGITADWDSGDDYVEITAVSGPANGILEVGDKIYQVNGKSLADSYFFSTHDPRVALGNAITDSEAGNGQMTFRVNRGGSTSDYTIQLPITNTAYSATWPKNCPKTDLIIENAATHYVDAINDWMTWETGGKMASFTALFLLSTGEQGHLDAVRTLMDSTDFDRYPASITYSSNNWYQSIRTMAYAEYYLRTGDNRVLPVIQHAVDHAFETESVGGWSHGYSVGNTAYVRSEYVGTGLLNAVGGQIFISMVLARDCVGIQMDDADFEKSLRYFYQYAGTGSPTYGDHRPDWGNAANGKASMIGVALGMLNEPYASAGQLLGAQDAMNVQAFEQGHGGNYTNVLYRGLASALIPDQREDAYRHCMDNMRWYLELCRSPNGSFKMLPAGSNTNYDDGTWGVLMSLYYSGQRKQLRMTGAAATPDTKDIDAPSVMRKSADHLQLTHAGIYTDSDYGEWDTDTLSNPTLDDVKKHLHHWNPLVRNTAAHALGKMAIADNSNPSDPAVDLVLEAIESSDIRVRTAGMRALTSLEAYHPGSFSDVEFDTEDYHRIAPKIIEVIENSEDHWELDAATWALSRTPKQYIEDNTALIVPLLEYEDSWWVRYAAFRAISRLSGEDLKPHLMDLAECFVTEIHNDPRREMADALDDDVQQLRDNGLLNETEVSDFLKVMGDDLVGGHYPRDYGYQQGGGHHYDSHTIRVVRDAFTLEELAQISDEIGAAVSRYTNPIAQGDTGLIPFVKAIDDFQYDWTSDPATIDSMAPWAPVTKAIIEGNITEEGSGPWLETDAPGMMDDALLTYKAYEEHRGPVEISKSYYFTVDPPTTSGVEVPFPDHRNQIIHYKLEEGSGTLVRNHGMAARSADLQLSDSSGWSTTGVAPGSSFSLDANKAWATADNSHFNSLSKNSYVVTSWVSINASLPEEEAHYVAVSSLNDFDFGIRRFDHNGEWKNTLFYHAKNWPDQFGSMYALNDTLGRPDIFLEEGKDYFIMFELRRDNELHEKTLFHVYDPSNNIWLTSNGNHGESVSNIDFDAAKLHLGIGSINSDTIDPSSRFPGLIDSVQMWSDTRPSTQVEKFTLATQGAIQRVTHQPFAYMNLRELSGTSALFDCYRSSCNPYGSNLTIYYGLNDGGTNPANWQHSISFANTDTIDNQQVLIESLRPNSDYYVRTHASNPVGAMLEHWSPVAITFKTLTPTSDIDPPIADAGADVVTIDDDRSGTATVTLNGYASSDNIGIETYTWTDSNNTILSTGPDAVQSIELASGFHLLTLTTTDFNGNTDVSQFEVDVISGHLNTAPRANAGVDQYCIDYNGDGLVAVELYGSASGSNGITPVKYTWEMNGNIIANGENPEVNLPLGENHIILTVEGANGEINQDSFHVQIVTEREGILDWTDLTDLEDHYIVAAQDFKGLGEGLARGSGNTYYDASDDPGHELAFWPFTSYNQKNDEDAASGISDLADVRANEALSFISTRAAIFNSWSYTSDVFDLYGLANASLSFDLLLSNINYTTSNTASAVVKMTMYDGTTEETSLFAMNGDSGLDFVPSIRRTFHIPDDAATVQLVVRGRLSSKWMAVDNILLVAEDAEPAVVTTTSADNITSTGARINGTVTDNGGNDPTIKFLFGTSDAGASLTGWDSVIDLTGTRSRNFNTTLSGLNELTTYYYRIYAENSGGSSFSQTAEVFRTPPISPINPPEVSALAATSVSVDSATLNGQIDNGYGDAPFITIYYGDNNGGTNTGNWDYSAQLGYQDGSFSFSTNNLALYQRYYYRVRAQGFGGSTWSDTQSFVTSNPGESIFVSVQSNKDMTAASWDRGTIPSHGDIVIMNGYLRFRQADGESFDAAKLILRDELDVYNSISFNEVILEPGSAIFLINNNDTVSFDHIVVDEGSIIHSGNRSGQKVVANRISGNDVFTWRRPHTTLDLNDLAEIDCPDMTGFTGQLIIGGVSYDGGPVDLTQDIAPSDASFSMDIKGDGNFLALSGHIAVTALTVDSDWIPQGKYTLDTAANPDATDLRGLNGRDYSAFFGDLGGTITVTQATPPIELAEISANAVTGITVSTANLSGEVINTGGQSPIITLFYGESDQNNSTTGWDGQVDLGRHSRSFSLTLDPLDDNTQYFYRFYAQNAAGGSFISNTETFTTLELRAPVVATRAATATTETAARIRGAITDDGNAPTNATFYYGTSDGGTEPNNWSHSIDLGEHRNGSISSFLTGLTPNEEYFYRIHVTNLAGESWSGAASFRASTADGLIYLQHFNDANEVQLHGTAPDYRPGSEVWDNSASSNTGIFTTGRIAGGGNRRKGIWLPFTPVAGKIYTLSADILSDQGGEGVALSFAQNNANHQWNTSDVTSYGTFLVRDEGDNRYLSTYTGLRSAGIQNIPSDSVPSYGYIAASVVLDATDPDSANWTMEFFMDGVSVRSPQKVSSGDFGNIQYIGLSKNNGGGTVRDFTLIESHIVRAPTVTSNGSTEIKAYSATIHGEVTNTGGEAPTVTIFYGKSDRGETAIGWDNSITLHSVSSTFTQDLSGLTPGETYHYRLRATNSAGAQFSAPDQFTSLSIAPDLSFSEWRDTTLSTAQQTEYANNPNIDFDNDGLSTIKEFYFDKNPHSHDSTIDIDTTVMPAENTFKTTYHRRKNFSGVRVRYEYSLDLQNWNSLDNYSVETQDSANGMEQVDLSVPISTQKAFIRIFLEEE